MVFRWKFIGISNSNEFMIDIRISRELRGLVQIERLDQILITQRMFLKLDPCSFVSSTCSMNSSNIHNGCCFVSCILYLCIQLHLDLMNSNRVKEAFVIIFFFNCEYVKKTRIFLLSYKYWGRVNVNVTKEMFCNYF